MEALPVPMVGSARTSLGPSIVTVPQVSGLKHRGRVGSRGDFHAGPCPSCCALGFEGPRCQVEVDECLSGPCPTGASCLDLPGAFFCLCPSGFTGQQGKRWQALVGIFESIWGGAEVTGGI